MKRTIAFVLCTMVVLTMCGCGKNNEVSIINDTSAPEEEIIGMPNPFVEGLLEESIQLAGFDFSVPEQIAGYAHRTILSIEDELIQTYYYNDDVSGDYNTYSEVHFLNIGDLQVTVKGENHMIYVATWTDSSYSFSTYIFQSNKKIPKRFCRKLYSATFKPHLLLKIIIIKKHGFCM